MKKEKMNAAKEATVENIKGLIAGALYDGDGMQDICNDPIYRAFMPQDEEEADGENDNSLVDKIGMELKHSIEDGEIAKAIENAVNKAFESH